jgi:predicted house-cleaning NTP pyrophosphatase (Maf/HAM1 superfamily)
MLNILRGRAHAVVTGVALRRGSAGNEWHAAVQTSVVMRPYSDDEVESYIARGEPFDKAGAYAVQDDLFRPVQRLEGCYLNVVGLPLCAVARGLETLGVTTSRSETGPLLPPCTYCRAGEDMVRIRGAQP